METVNLTSEQTMELFEHTGGLLHGHFRLTSGLHSTEYLQCALVLQHPDIASRLGAALARAMESIDQSRRIDVVAAPAIGGLIIGHEVAKAVKARFVFTERDAEGRMSLRRGFTIEPGETAFVIEDVVTTGGSSREVVDLLKKAGAHVIAAGSIVDRSGGEADIGVPRTALATLRVVTYAPDECPMCAEGSVAVKPGSRPV